MYPFLSLCLLKGLGSPHVSYMDQAELAEHMEMSYLSHLDLVARSIKDLINHFMSLENHMSIHAHK